MSRYRVLIADSDDMELAAYRDYLTSHDFIVSTARTGLACLESLADGIPDVIVFDTSIIEEWGDEVLIMLSEGHDLPWIRLIVLSASDDLSARAKLAAVPVSVWLVKPLTPSDLAQNIRRVLSLPALNNHRFVSEWA